SKEGRGCSHQPSADGRSGGAGAQTPAPPLLLGARVVEVPRTLTLKLAKLDQPTWRRLRDLAAQAASYGNHVIDIQWAVARGFSAPKTPPKWVKQPKPRKP